MTYSLVTIADIFNKIPADRIQCCMDELGKIMTVAKSTQKLIQSVAEDKYGKKLPDLYKWPDAIEWMDDGKEDLEARFLDQDQKILMSVKIEKKRAKK